MSLDLKRKQVELIRVEAAKMEQELKISEYEDSIERLKKTIEIQESTICRLKKEIIELDNK